MRRLRRNFAVLMNGLYTTNVTEWGNVAAVRDIALDVEKCT